MRVFVLVFLTVVTLVMASTASASLPISYIDYPVDNTTPTIRSCVAYSAYGQKCRQCSPAFNPDGTVAKWTCVSVSNSQNFCTCGDMTGGRCTPKGLCQYV